VLNCWTIGIKKARLLCPQVSLLYPQPGYVEIDPDALWSKVVAVVKEAISGITFFQLKKYHVVNFIFVINKIFVRPLIEKKLPLNFCVNI
jgi:glycerol kinase